jgi:signal transduction histidine kinase/AmiR/NasT family two-component response regulator
MKSKKRLFDRDSRLFSYIVPIALIICMFAVIFSVCVNQLSESREHIHTETLSELSKNSQIISQQFNDMYVSLNAAAPQLAFEAGFSREQMLLAMRSLRSACGFDYVVRTNTDGIAFNYLGKGGIDLSKRQYIQTAISGQPACEYVKSGTYDPSSAYVILAVPIFYHGTPVGVLHGSYKVANFDGMLSRFAGSGRSQSGGIFVIDRDDTVIAASDRNTDCSPFIRVLLHGAAAENAAAGTVAARVNAGKSGYFNLIENGQRQYYYYMPLTDVDCCQWVMVTAVSQASVEARVQSLKTGMTLLCTVAACITSALIYSFLRRQRLAVLQGENALALSKALGDAKRANEAKSEFLSRMSHDMRTPLNGIIGMTYLTREMELPEKARENLGKIDTSSKFLLSLINDVLDMSKAESGTIELHPEPYPFGDFCSYIDAVIRPLCEEKRQTFVFDSAPIEGYTPLVDITRLNRIYFNLLSNAVKFTPEGGTITLKIREESLPDGHIRFTITVSDNGIGMSREFQERLFEPFMQENRDDSSNMRGTGLGLAIVRRTVDAMGGAIRVESKKGVGTSFIVSIVSPCIQRTEPEETAAVPTSGPDYSGLAGRHVLLCEDHPLNQEIARALLTGKKMFVQIAEDGQKGAEAFAASPAGYFDCILMDIRMPVMDGYEAARAIRALDRPDAKTVPILAMTADAFADDVQKCLDAGMNGHISKPIEPDVLFGTLSAVISLSDRKKLG